MAQCLVVFNKTETTCCCGNSTCDGSCYLDADSSQESHSYVGESHAYKVNLLNLRRKLKGVFF